MTTIKNFCVLFSLAFAALFCSTNELNAQTQVDSSFVFTAGDPSQWNVATLRYPLADGRHVMATHKSSNTQLIIVVRSRKIAAVGTMAPGGSFKSLLPTTSAPCSSTLRCYSFQIKRCFIFGGQCFCICGAWYTT